MTGLSHIPIRQNKCNTALNRPDNNQETLEQWETDAGVRLGKNGERHIGLARWEEKQTKLEMCQSWFNGAVLKPARRKSRWFKSTMAHHSIF